MHLSAVIFVIILYLSLQDTHAAHPNNSIAPEPPPATPYGASIVRSEEGPFIRNVALDEAPPNALVSRSAIANHLTTIARVERSSGPYSLDLVEPLMDIGRVYQLAGMHSQALKDFGKAMHLLRINNGLYDPDQLPVLDSIFNSQLASSLLSEADETREYRYRVEREAYEPSGEQMLIAATDYTAWKRELYLEKLGYRNYINILEIYNAHDEILNEISEEGVVGSAQIPHLYQRMHAEYLISRYEGENLAAVRFASSDASGMKNLPDTSLEAEQFRKLRKHNFRNGKSTGEKIISLAASQKPLDADALVRAEIALGDWYLWWQRPAPALRYYRSAYNRCTIERCDIGHPDLLFATPIELPDERIFHKGITSIREDDQGWAKLQFKVSRLGQAQHIEVLEIDPPDYDPARLAVRRMLKQFRFRPVLRNREVVDSENIVRDYYFEY